MKKQLNSQEIVSDFTDCLSQHDICLVCFNFDQTITVNEKQSISKTFVRLLQKLHQMNFHIAITTFNLGYDIASLFEEKHILEKDEKPYFIPIIRRATNFDFQYGKLWHIREAMKIFNLPPDAFHQVILFDNLKRNVYMAKCFDIVALEVQNRKGIQRSRICYNFWLIMNFIFHLKIRKFIPSIATFSTSSLSKNYVCHLAANWNQIEVNPHVINIILQKNSYENPYLVGIVCQEESKEESKVKEESKIKDSSLDSSFESFDYQVLFLVVKTQIEIFLQDFLSTQIETLKS